MNDASKLRRARPVVHHRPAGTGTGGRRRDEDGFVLVFSALLLVVLMLFAAFAVDLGSWYARAAQIQRGADAAALAGVVWMPNDFDTATDEARDVAARNGLVHGEDNVTVEVSRIDGRPQQLQVTIIDSNVEAYFGKMAVDHITLERTAVARFVLPVPLGSPLNGFGNQGVPTSSAVSDTSPQFWAAINAPYTAKVQGDPYATKCVTVPNSLPARCSGAENTEYRESGYLYAVSVPPGGQGKTLTVEVFDSSFFARPLGVGVGEGFVDVAAQNTLPGRLVNGPVISYELFDADATPLDNSDNPSLDGQCLSGPGQLMSGPANLAAESWSTVCTITVDAPGIYPFRVKSSGHQGQPDRGAASAHYSVRARLSPGAVQPRVYALNDMSIFTGLATSSTADAVAEFYLAEVEEAYAGKDLAIELYDPGDGSAGNFHLSVLRPDGSTAQCQYSSPSGVMGASDTCRIQTRRTSTSPANLYDGKWLKVIVELPTDYSCKPGKCWWKIKYEFLDGARPTDRTVWRVNVVGDPVSLIA